VKTKVIAAGKDEKKKGRFPKELDIVKVKLPAELEERLSESQGAGSEEQPD
jgi:hypothetical protein